MITRIKALFFVVSFLAATFTFGSAGPAVAQENPPPQPVDLPCATNVSAQVLGSTLVNDDTQALIQARIVFGPGGKLDLHTHPGSLIVTVESGQLGFTHQGDGDMTVNRAVTGADAAIVDPLSHGELVEINPGDWFIETGMTHTAENLAAGETTVLLTGLLEPGVPLVICV